MSFENSIADFDGKVITLSNGSHITLNNNNEFEFENEIYTVYKNYTTTRTHYTLVDFKTEKFAIPCIIPRKVAVELINYIIDLSVCLIHFVDEHKNSLVHRSFTDAFKSLQTELENLIKDHSQQTKEAETITKTLEILSTHLDIKDIEKGTYSSNLDSIVTVLDTTTSVSEILSKLMEYVTLYITFDDATIKHRTLNSSMDRIYTILCIISYYMSTPILVNMFTDKNAIIGHRICEVLFDCLTDRTTRELFAQGRNPEAKKILSKYERQYPFLLNSNLEQILTKASQSQTFKSAIEHESIVLYPFILLCRVSDMDRLGYLYDYFSSNKSQIDSFIGSMKWPSKTEYFTLLNSFISVYKQPCIYDVSKLVEILPKFINIGTEEE